MGTGEPVKPGDLITAEKMNKKLENVETEDIVDGAVTTSKIADGAITPELLAFGTWQRIFYQKVEGSDVGQIVIDGLDGEKDLVYILVCTWKNTSDSGQWLGFYVNDDLEDTHYKTLEILMESGHTYRSGTYSQSISFWNPAGTWRFGYAVICGTGHQPLCTVDTVWDIDKRAVRVVNYLQSIEKITKITLKCSGGNYIGVGSRFALFKLL
mgnify:CR=1 FL=1